MTYTFAYEIFKIFNCNADTKSFADEVGKYLQGLSVNKIHICADGNQHDNENEIPASVCEALGEYKKIEISVSSFNGFFAKRLAEAFNDNLKDYVTYKVIAYYDDNAGADACVFDKEGLRYPDNFTEEVPNDVKKWFCYTPYIIIRAEDSDNQELYNSIKNKIDKLKSYCTIADIFEDWNEYGIMGMGISFDTSNIPQIIEILQSIKDEITEYNSGDFRLLINGVPDGENDYDFAIARISCNPEVKAEFLKF